jgi:hypothetical protein
MGEGMRSGQGSADREQPVRSTPYNQGSFGELTTDKIFRRTFEEPFYSGEARKFDSVAFSFTFSKNCLRRFFKNVGAMLANSPFLGT